MRHLNSRSSGTKARQANRWFCRVGRAANCPCIISSILVLVLILVLTGVVVQAWGQHDEDPPPPPPPPPPR